MLDSQGQPYLASCDTCHVRWLSTDPRPCDHEDWDGTWNIPAGLEHLTFGELLALGYDI